MKVLVCGAHGQLGRALQQPLADHDVVNSDIDTVDIADFVAARGLVESVGPDIVINCAAYTRVDDAEDDVANAYRTNALGPRNLAVATQAHGISLLQISTDYVFDGTKSGAYHEFDEPCPASVYGASKLAGERAVATLNPHHYIARTAWLYADEGANFPLTMLRLADREEVRVVDDQHGSPTYAPHLAQALVELMQTRSFGIWHLAGGGHTTWHGLASRLYQVMGLSTAVVPVTTDEFPRPAPRPACSILESLQSPSIALPRWESGLDEFVTNHKAT